MKKEKKENTVEHYNAILLEEIRSQMKFVIEGMQGVEQRLERKMDEKFAAVDQRFDVVEAVLKKHTQDIAEIKTEMHQIEARFDKKVDGLDKKVDSLDKKVDSLDKKVDSLDKKVDGLDKKVDSLDKKIDNVEASLKKDLKEMGDKLSSKIDTHNDKLTDHDNRISVIENDRM